MVTDPYGGKVSGSAATPYVFSDQERDSETGFDYFGARFYDPLLGRFLSQDPELIGPHEGVTFSRIGLQSESTNAFAYAYNRPTSLVDPSGEFVLAIDGTTYFEGTKTVHFTDASAADAAGVELGGKSGAPSLSSAAAEATGASSGATSGRQSQESQADTGGQAEVTPGTVDPNGPLSSPEVRSEIRDAWTESLSGTEYSREQGGWIVKYDGAVQKVRSFFGLSDTAVSRWPAGGPRGIIEGRRPFFGTVIGKFHTHPGSNFPVGSNPQDLFNSVPSYVIARGGVTRINLDNTQNFLGPRSAVLR